MDGGNANPGCEWCWGGGQGRFFSGLFVGGGGDGDLEEFPSAAVFGGEVEDFVVAAEGQGQGLQVPGFGSSDLSNVFYVVGVTNEEDARSIEVAAGLFGSKERGGFAIR